MRRSLCLFLASSCLALLGGCGGADSPETKEPPAVEVTPPPFGKPFDDLSDWHLFTDDAAQVPADRLIPYEVNSPLFTDYATKSRFLFVPKGKKITYEDDSVWELPVGSALVKNFAMLADLRDDKSDLRLLETRILFHEPDGWSVQTYVWSEDQKKAIRSVAGPIISLTFKGEHGETVHDDYTVPNTNQCKDCHANDDKTLPLGAKTRQLDRDHDYGGAIGVKNQIDELAALELVAGKIPAKAQRTALVDPYGKGALDLRVRAYWDGNCAHCHTHGGSASQSSLLLDFPSTDPDKNPSANWGVCKSPTSGGFGCGKEFDVVPGNADESIMSCRVSTTNATYRMPRIGIRLLNQEGIDLIRQWIGSLPKDDCSGH